MRPVYRRSLYVLVCLVFILLATQMPVQFVYNGSPSLPLGYYRALHSPPPYSYGEIVWFFEDRPRQRLAVERGYIGPREKFLKYVFALPGDTYCRLASPASLLPAEPAAHFFVRGRYWGPVQLYDSRDNYLPQLPDGCRRVPVGHFLPGTHMRRSYDGRYYGVVSQTSVSARLLPLWTW